MKYIENKRPWQCLIDGQMFVNLSTFEHKHDMFDTDYDLWLPGEPHPGEKVHSYNYYDKQVSENIDLYLRSDLFNFIKENEIKIYYTTYDGDFEPLMPVTESQYLMFELKFT